MPRSLLNPFMVFGQKVSLTVNANPSGSTVSFNTGTIIGNTCLVNAGASVEYTVSYPGLETLVGNITVYSDTTLTVDLHYADGVRLFESSSAGSTTLSGLLIDNVLANIICVGGGGGGATHRSKISGIYFSVAAGGGSGGYSRATANISNGLSITIGSKGTRRSSVGTASGGGASSVGSIVSAGGGAGGTVSSTTASGGNGGSGNTSNGNKGKDKNSSTSASAAGGDSVYNGHGQGMSVSVSSSGSSTTRDATTGYVNIATAARQSYVLTVTPLNNENVTLLTANHTQVGTSIEVDVGEQVMYLVSKDGFVPLINTIEINADTTITVTLKQAKNQIIDCETIVPSSLDIEWEQKQLGEQAFNRTDYVAIDDGTTWFFFGASGYCYTSVDLNTFSAAVTLGISPKSVVLVGNTFVALTSEGLIYTASKSDLTTWTQVADISSIDSLWQGLCVGNGCIIAFGGHIAKSTDTTSWATWNQVTVSGYYYGVTKNGMVWDGTQFCGLQSYASPAFVTSPDGGTWTYKGYAAGIMTSDPRLFGYYAGMYIQVSRNGEVWESSDGAQWVQNPSSVPFSRGCAGGFSADGSQIVVVEYGGANLAISNNTIVVDPAQEIDCGLIEDSVVETIDCGKIM